MRRLFWLMVLVMVGGHTHADTLKEGDCLRGHFVQERHMVGFNHPVRSEGSFVVVPGHGLIWRTEKPFAVTTIVTPSGVTQTTDGTTVMHLDAAKLPFLSQLYFMIGGAMAGDWKALEQGFSVERSATQVSLKPKDGQSAILGISATLNRFIETVEITKAGGDYDHLSFSDQSVAQGGLYPDEQRILDGPPP